MKIPFNKLAVLGTESEYLTQAMNNQKLSGDGVFTRQVEQWLEQHFHTPKALLTPSCTAALEMAAILIDIQPGDEVIMPSYTFVSTANAFVLRGAKIVFVDIEPKFMNLDVAKIASAITHKTKAIVPVHYAGVACDMDRIMQLANQYQLWVIEDAAQGVMSTYNNKALGTIGHIGCYSFHDTKNYTSGGEGGAILINDPKLIERAEIIREKGTNRSQFFRGEIDKYTWRDIGSSFLMSELQAAYLYAQLIDAEKILMQRQKIWNNYFESFKERLSTDALPALLSKNMTHNAHLFFIKLADEAVRNTFIEQMKQAGISCVFHYVPLHSSPAGKRFGRFHGVDEFTTQESLKLIRLPLFYNMTEAENQLVIDNVLQYLP